MTFATLTPPARPSSIYDVSLYGAVPGGVVDATAGIQGAVTDLQNSGGGGTVLFPGESYLISSTIVAAADDVQFEGSGWGTQLIAAAGWVAGTYMIQVQGPGGAGNFRYGIRIADLFLNGNNVAGVNGIDLVSTYGALIDHVRLRYIVGINILMDGIAGAFGAYNWVRNCLITDGGATGVGIETNNSEWLTIQGGHIGYFQGGTAVGVLIQNLNCVIDGVQFDYNDTAVWVKFAGRTTIVGCQFDRGWTHFFYLNDTQNNVVEGCFFGVKQGTATDLGFVDGAGNAGNNVRGCSVEAASGWTNFINEGSGIGGQNLYTNNQTGALPLVLRTGIARGNVGYNPVGKLTAQPAVPASATAYTNTSGVDCDVFVVGGTVSAIALGGNATGLTSGVFHVAAGQSITLTYTAAPTWLWFGE